MVNTSYKICSSTKPFQKKITAKNHIKGTHTIKFRHFFSAYPRCFQPFTMFLHFSLKKISPKFASATTRKWRLIASCCNAFCTKTHRNMHQNAVHFAPKRNAICTKMQCNLHQNAVQFALKCKVNASKCTPKPIKSTILSVICRHFGHLE